MNVNKHKIKVYNFASSGNGCVDLNVYREAEYMLLNDTHIQILKDGYAFKVKGKNNKFSCSTFRFEWAIKLAYFFIDIVIKVRYNES